LGPLLILAAFVGCYLLGRKSIGRGMGALVFVGYVYAVLRAWVLDGAAHFIFDAAVLGLYFAQLLKTPRGVSYERSRSVVPWVFILVGIPVILFLIPIHNFVIQLIGLRAAAFFIPLALIGARATASDLDELSRWLIGLNLGAFALAVFEFFFGFERIFPLNAVTALMYGSADVAGRSHRIPSCFANAHAYAGTMLATLPFLINRWQAPGVARIEKTLAATAIFGSCIGMFMAGVRLPIAMLFIELGLLVVSLKLSLKTQVSMALVALIVGYVVMSDERMQRFTSIFDVEKVSHRVSMSVGASTIIDVLEEHPVGEGLGSAFGTSIPYFLNEYNDFKHVSCENEYVRIWIEQTPLGLFAWVAFILRATIPRPRPVSPEWQLGTKIARAYAICSWATVAIGTGLLQSIPTCVLILFIMGLLCARPRSTAATRAAAPVARAPRSPWEPAPRSRERPA
jgi:hypothetical protein